MSLEPSLAATVARLAGDEAVEHGWAVDGIVWADFRACPVCKAPTGEPCCALNGRVAGGRPDGIRTPLPRAHVARKRRTGR